MNPQPMNPLQDLIDRSQDLEADYRATQPGAQWTNSPFRWLLAAPSATKGRVGRELILHLCRQGGIPIGTAQGNVLSIRNRHVVVKLSTLWDDDETYRFQQLKDQPYDHVACIGLSPQSAHLWVIPKAVAWSRTGPQHGGQVGRDTHWLTVSPQLPATWLSQYGGSLQRGLAVLAGI